VTEVQEQFEYYKAHQDELVKLYNGKFVVIVKKAVVGDFTTEADAYAFATRNYAAGKFMIQRVSPGTTDYTQTFHSRAVVPG